jgi:hypothetical protein
MQSLPWGESLFCDAFTDAWRVIEFISNHQKPLAEYRVIAALLKKEDSPEGGTELLKYGYTRFASRVMMLKRFEILNHW